MVVEQNTNFYASNLELGTIPQVFVHPFGRSPWVIDTEVFQSITTDGHLKKPSVHQGRGQALIVLTMIRVLGLHPDPGVLPSPGSQPFQKLFFRFLRFGSQAGVSICGYCPAGFQLSPSYN